MKTADGLEGVPHWIGGACQLTDLLGHLEHVEDELLHLNAVGLLGFPGDAVVIHVRDLLLGDVVQQSRPPAR